MKMTKKILALVMAVAMLFSLCMFSANAYNGTGYVNVEIQYDDDYAWDVDLDASTISSYITSGYHIYTVPTGVSHTTALTAADAILAAYLVNYGPYDDTQVHYTGYTNSGVWGIYFDIFEGIEDESYSASGTYYYTYSNGVYDYYWEGYAWKLTINGFETSMYSSAYELGTPYTEFSGNQPTSIVLNYTLMQSEHFQLNYLIPGAQPATNP